MRILTIGFTKKSAEHFFEELRKAGVRRVVDVRLNNVPPNLRGSQKGTNLAYFLETICHVDYVHVPSLAPTKDMLDGYRKRGVSWDQYERRFLELMAERRIEERLEPEISRGFVLAL